MPASTLLVDPLAALFRTGLAGLPPLLLDDTVIDVQLVAPLAHVAIARRFRNSSDRLIEAVVTLPPIAPDEILFRLIIRIGGIDYHAHAQPAGRARQAHDAAVAGGKRAILYELLAHDIPMISIAGIEPGAQVEILTWSVRPLARPEAGRARLVIRLNAAMEASIFGLPDADASITTPQRHAASLTVSAGTRQVTISGQPYPDRQLICGEAIGIECATPVVLDIVPLADGALDHSEWHVDKPGGWEVTSEHGIERLRHPANPGGSVVSDRDDWIFGSIATTAGRIGVTAPLPDEGAAPNAGGWFEIAPNARAMRAFAAAGFIEAATPRTGDDVRRTANIINRRTSLAFVGPEGELPDEIPLLRKLALPEMQCPDFQDEGESVDPAPFRDIPPPARPLDLPSLPDAPMAPGIGQAAGHWLAWGAMLLIVGAFAASFMAIELPFLAVIAVFAAMMLASAWRFRPPAAATVRGRLPLLALLPLPWIASLCFGPLACQMLTGDMPAIEDWMIPFQIGLLVAAAALPCVLIAILPGARRSALVLGVLNFILAFFMVATSVITLTPGT